MSIRAVIFDVYGTLLEVGPPPPEAAARWDRLWRHFWAKPPRLSLAQFAAECDAIIAREHAAARLRGIAWPEVCWPAVVCEVLPELAACDPAAREEFLFQQACLWHTVRLAGGVAEALQALRDRGLLLGIASNAQAYTLRELAEALARAGLTRAATSLSPTVGEGRGEGAASLEVGRSMLGVGSSPTNAQRPTPNAQRPTPQPAPPEVVAGQAVPGGADPGSASPLGGEGWGEGATLPAPRPRWCGLFERDLCFWSFEHGFSKPDPHVFQILTARCAARGISAHEILMVGDRLDTDIEPARAAGWRTWHFDGTPSSNWPALAERVRSGAV